MKCNNCGQECFGEEQFCPKCGTSLGANYSWDEIDFIYEDISNSIVSKDAQVEERYLEQKPKHHRRTWIPIIVGSAILIGILVVMTSLEKPSNQRKLHPYIPVTQQSLASLYSRVNDIYNTSLLSLDGKVVAMIESEQVYAQISSISHEVVAKLDTNHKLYVVTTKEHTIIDNNVESSQVSLDGSSIAYIKDVTIDNKDLYLYDRKAKSSIKIASGVSSDYYVLSPDGDSIAYCTEGENGSQQEIFVRVDKKEPERIASGYIPLGISNHGNFLYALGEAGFYAFTGEETIRLGNKFDLNEFQPIFNLDYTQVLYYVDEKSYLSEEGKITMLADSRIYGIELPPDAGLDWKNSGTSSFVNHVVQKEDGLYYLNDQYELVFLCKNTEMKQVATNWESLLILENQQLYLLKDFHQKAISKVKVVDAQHIKTFVANADLSIVYYINDKEELYSYKVGGKPIKIAEEVFDCSYNFLDGCWYYITEVDRNREGNLYYSTNQGTGIKVKNINRGYMYHILGGIICTHYTDGKYSDTYVLFNGEAKKVLSRVSS